jgi:hypothetical protein
MRELEHLVDDLRDPKLDIERRRRAAAILLDRRWPAAVSALRRQLFEADPVAHRAIAQAVAGDQRPPIDLLQPLMALLATEDAAIREDAALALERFEEPGVAEQLAELAADTRRSPTLRRGALRALAQHRTKPAAQTMLALTQDADGSVRSAAFAALAQLSGLSLGQDADAWQEWWQSVRHLSDPAWLAMLVRNLSGVNTTQAKQVQVVTDRLLAAQTALYDATPETGRTTLLNRMLVDPMEELRLLSLKLIERRVLNAQTVSAEVRTAMRQRLTDRSADVRIQTAKLLENLADAEGAQTAIELLLAENEPAVQAAYLALLARVPQAPAVEPALLVIDRPGLRSPAASVIVAAADAKMLTDEQAARALRIARFHLVDNPEPEPAMLRLIARLGSDADQPLITAHFTHADTATRIAAAEAFVASNWRLAPLVAHLDDPVLWPVIIQGVTRRGVTFETLAALIDGEPSDQARVQPWREAVIAVASRLATSDLDRIDQKLGGMIGKTDLHEDVLKAAAGLVAPPAAALAAEADAAELENRRIDAAFKLAEFYVVSAQPSKAKAVYERLDARTTLTLEQRHKLAAMRLALLLDGGNYEEAGEATRKLMVKAASVPALDPNVLAEPWLTAAQRALDDNRIEAARTLVIHAHGLFGSRLKDPAAQRLQALRQKLLPTPPAPKAKPTVKTPSGT